MLTSSSSFFHLVFSSGFQRSILSSIIQNGSWMAQESAKISKFSLDITWHFTWRLASEVKKKKLFRDQSPVLKWMDTGMKSLCIFYELNFNLFSAKRWEGAKGSISLISSFCTFPVFLFTAILSLVNSRGSVRLSSWVLGLFLTYWVHHMEIM